MINGKVPTWWCEGCSRAITRVAPKFVTLPFTPISIQNYSTHFFIRVDFKILYFVDRFNLRLKVKDQTGESKLLLLDTVAQKMLKVEANKILQGCLDEVTI